jgi:hypothetical protein
MIFYCDKFQELRDDIDPFIMLPADLLSNHLIDFDEWKVCRFISACMQIIDTDERGGGILSPSEAEQPAG